MFKGNNNTAPVYDKVETIIGKSITFEGNLKGTGSIKIEGKFHGDNDIQGDIIISAGAEYTGDIKATNVTCSGTINGNIALSNQLYLTATAQVNGDVAVKAFVVDEGASLTGNCKMIMPAPDKLLLNDAKEIKK